MVGIDIDILDSLVRRNNSNLKSYNSNSAKLLNIISELNYCYKGNKLEYLFGELTEEKNNIEKIPKIIENYSEVLNEVKISYEKQDLSMKNEIEHMN